METIMIEEDGQWYKFVIPASADGAIDFFPAGYTGQYYAVQRFMEGGTSWEHHGSAASGFPAHDQCVGGTLPDAYLVFQSGETVKGKRVKMR
jgi:hypothetical protein